MNLVKTNVLARVGARGVSLLAVLLAVSSTSVFSATEGFPAGELTQRLVFDLSDKHLETFSLLEAALVAGGIDRLDQLECYQQQIEDIGQQLAEEISQVSSPRERAAEIFRFMHKRLLTGSYRQDCNCLATTLENGDFNCLTATILYCWLGSSCQLPMEAVEEVGHIRGQVSFSVPLAIETTISDWQKAVSAVPSGGSRWVPHGRSPPAGRRSRSITTVQLIARVFYNRGIVFFENHDFSRALHLTRISLELDNGHQPSRRNLLAGLNNQALWLAERGRFRSAASLLFEIEQLDASYAPLLANDLHIHQRWVLSLCSEGRYAESLEILEACHRRRPEIELFQEGRTAVQRLWVEAQSAIKKS